MRAVIQRVSSASVISDGKLTGKIDKGFAILLGVKKTDEKEDAEALRDRMVRVLEEPERFIGMSRAVRQTFLDNAEFNKASGTIRRVLDEVKTYF